MMWFALAVLILSLALLIAQERHYRHLEEMKRAGFRSLEFEAVEERLKDFDAYKKRVDALTVRAGFTN